MCAHLRHGRPATATSPSYYHPIERARRLVLKFYDDANADEVAHSTSEF